MPVIPATRRGLVVLACLLLATVACLLLALAVAGPVAASPEERRLEQARERLQEVRDELEQAREARDAEARALEVATQRVEEVLAAVGEAELAVERQEQAVEEAEAELDGLTEEADTRAQRTSDRVLKLYKSGGGHRSLGSVLSAVTPGEVLARSSLLDAINRSDRWALEGLVASRTAVDAQADRLEEARHALERVLEQQRELLAEVEELREDKAIALAERERKLDRLESHEAHVAAESRQLAAIARQAEARAQRSQRASRSGSAGGGSAAPASGGGWTWPARGTVTSEYGMRWGRLHAGIDVASGRGSAIFAARGGTVSHAGWLGGYGNLVTVNHGGGVVTAYAHLSSIEVRSGQQVSAGQRIGRMGCTGSCTGTHVHFEVRVNGNPRNPRGYLP